MSEIIIGIVDKIRQLLCRHEYRPTKYQALVPGTSYECVKCKKFTYDHFPSPKSKPTQLPQEATVSEGEA